MSEPMGSSAKDNDFRTVRTAAGFIERQLLADEAFLPELDWQYAQNSDPVTSTKGAFKVFLEPYKSGFSGVLSQQAPGGPTTGQSNSNTTPMMKLQQRIPLPADLQALMEGGPRNTSSQPYSIMGILSEINRIWVTVDNALYLWDYMTPGSPYEEVLNMNTTTALPNALNTGANTAPIVSVALSAPKPGVFLDSVKYILVVATTLNVAILALKSEPDTQSISLLETQFVVGNDDITIKKVIGTQKGRVFMCGADNNLYELFYENTDTTWATLTGAPRYKCAKIKHSGWNWSLHLMNTTLFNNGMNSLVDCVCDDVRNVVYTADSDGYISALFLGTNGTGSGYIFHSYNLFNACYNYLRKNRGMNRNGSPNESVFATTNVASNNLAITALSTTSMSESRRVHLVVILNNGVRVYVRLRNADRSVYLDTPDRTKIPKRDDLLEKNSLEMLPKQANLLIIGNGPYAPNQFEIVFVRSPPGQDIFDAHDQIDPSQEHGFLPALKSSDTHRSNNALYNQGVFLYNVDRGENGDDVVALCDDGWGREITDSDARAQRPALREALSIMHLEGKIHAIQENNTAINYEVACQLMSLHTVSATNRINLDEYDPLPSMPYDPRSQYSEVPALFGPSIAPGGRLASYGIPFNGYNQIPLLPERVYQHIPCRNFAFQRQFLVLESRAIHVFCKMRPCDYVYDALRRNQNYPDRLKAVLDNLYRGYGADQFCTILLGIACGLPSDAGGNPGLDTETTVGVNIEYDSRIRELALAALKEIGHLKKPKIKAGKVLDPQSVKQGRDLSTDDVEMSCMYNGLEILLSRIMRPLWLRNLSDQDLFGKWGAASFLSVELLNSLLVVLLELQTVMLKPDMFESIIKYNHRFTSYVHGKGMEVGQQGPGGHHAPLGAGGLNGGGQEAIPNQFQTHWNANMSAEDLRRRLAIEYENDCICKLYRLLTRSIQALQLLKLLLIAELDWRLPVNWTGYDLSFRRMVISLQSQDKIRKNLRQLILESSRHSRHKIADVKKMTLNLTSLLKQQCYMYYSEGDEKWHEAEESLADLENKILNSLSNIAVSPEVQKHAKHTIQLLVEAAAHWCDPSLVYRSNDSDKSELQRKCEQLMRLGNLGRKGVPELCMSSVRNFGIWPISYDYLLGGGSGHTGSHSLDASSLDTSDSLLGIGLERGRRGGNGGNRFGNKYGNKSMNGGRVDLMILNNTNNTSLRNAYDSHEIDDRGLYHGARELTTADIVSARKDIYKTLLDCIFGVKSTNTAAMSNTLRTPTAMRNNNNTTTSTSVGTGLVLGSSNSSNVSSGEILNISDVENIIYDMIIDSLRLCSNDPTFFELLCDKLYSEQKNVMLRLVEPFIEEYLKRNKDFELLYRWYGQHNYHDKAAVYMSTKALSYSNTGNNKICVEERIEYLRYALRSATSSGDSSKYTLQSLLNIAIIWRDIYKSFESMKTDLRLYTDAYKSAPMVTGNDEEEDNDDEREGNVAQLEYMINSIGEVAQKVYEGFVDQNSAAARQSADGDHTSAFQEPTWLLHDCIDYEAWEEYLLLSRAVSSSNITTEEIEKYWRSIIYRTIPLEEDSDAIADLFVFGIANSDDSVLYTSKNPATIEKYSSASKRFSQWRSWLATTATTVASLGRRLDGHLSNDGPGSDFYVGNMVSGARGTGSGKFNYFPLTAILKDLESIITILSISTLSATGMSNAGSGNRGGDVFSMSTEPPRQWAARILMDIKCSKSTILSAYLQLLEVVNHNHDGTRVVTGLSINLTHRDTTRLYEHQNNIVRDCYTLTLMDNSLSVLLEWLNTASQRGITKTADGVQNSDVRELNRFKKINPLLTVIDTLLQRMSRMTDANMLQEYFVEQVYIAYRSEMLARLKHVLRDVTLLQRQWMIAK